MPRPLEFDRHKALESAMKLFWSRGYTATSLPELLESMGIARSSFYSSFSTKRAVFIECLELFGERTLNIIEEDARRLPSTALPRAFFEATLLEVPQHRVNNGCMLVNTILELADVDPELNQLASEKLGAVEAAFARAFTIAQNHGQLTGTHNPTQLASLVMTINYGLRVQCRQNPSQKSLKQLLDNSLSLLQIAA